MVFPLAVCVVLERGVPLVAGWTVLLLAWVAFGVGGCLVQELVCLVLVAMLAGFPFVVFVFAGAAFVFEGCWVDVPYHALLSFGLTLPYLRDEVGCATALLRKDLQILTPIVGFR